MEPQRIATGTTEDEVWQQLAPDFEEDNNILEYQALLQQSDRKIILDIDIDPGGGFEGGYATTSFSSPISNNFSIEMYKQTLLAEAGKLFGLEDIETGFEDLDKRFIIKTDNEALVKEIFADYEVRKLFESDTDLELSTTTEKSGEDQVRLLQLVLEDGITNIESLRRIYSVFYKIVTVADPVKIA